jgi:hypothetical protein
VSKRKGWDVKGESNDQPHFAHAFKACHGPISLTLCLLAVRLQVLGLLAQIAFERGDLEVALDFAHRGPCRMAREDYATDPEAATISLTKCLLVRSQYPGVAGPPRRGHGPDAEWLASTPGADGTDPSCAWPSSTWPRGRMPRPSSS